MRSPRPTRCSAWSSKLLDLAGGRTEASAVLDLIAAEPVRRRFGFAENDLETIAQWVEQAGVRWSYDEQHRSPYGLEGYVQNTWRFGLDRVLAGVAMSDDAERWIGTTLPLDDVGSTSIELAGRLAELVDRLQHVTDQLTGSHPVGHWLDTLREGIESLTAVARGDEWQTGQVQRELGGLSDDAARQGAELELRLPDVRALMSERLAGQPTRANFRTGTLTVCTMVPMRSVPHRVVCLLGLDDGVFPRAPAVDGDDVLARTPLTGERDLRSEDRQLMLDAILAAREQLVVTYSGANETTGQLRPPAVPLGELLDALDDTVEGGREHALAGTHCRPSTPATCSHRCRSPSTARHSTEPVLQRGRASRSRRWPATHCRRGRQPTWSWARWWRSSGTRSGRSSAAVSGSPCSTRVTRSPTVCRSSSTTCRSGRWATGCCATCARPDSRARAGDGVAPRRAATGAARLAARPATDPGGQPGRRDGRVGHPGQEPRAVDVDVDLGGDAGCAAPSPVCTASAS